MVYRHPLAFLLGLEGVALLRAYAGDDAFDREFVDARIAETRTLLDVRVERGYGRVVPGPDRALVHLRQHRAGQP